MKQFDFDSYIYETNKNGFIISKKQDISGFIQCEYIPEIFTYQTVYTQLDLKGPIFVYQKCRMLKNFGPIKENEEFKLILLDYNVDLPHIDFKRNKKESIRLEFKNIK